MAKKKAVEKEIVVAQEAAMPAVQNTDAAWGMEEITAQDIIMPKLLLMQGLSKLVAAGEASIGQIVNSLSKEVVGGITNIKTKAFDPVEFICFKMFKTWLEFEKREGQWVYMKTFPMDMSNTDLAQEEVVNGIEIRRDRCMNYYVLTPEEIKKGSALPYVISFRRTSMQAGKKISSAVTRFKALGSPNPIACKTFKLGVEQKTKDTNSFWAFTVDEGRATNAAEQAEAKKWFMALQKMNVKIDESDLTEETVAPSESQDY